MHRPRQLISELAGSIASVTPGMFAAVLINRTSGSRFYRNFRGVSGICHKRNVLLRNTVDIRVQRAELTFFRDSCHRPARRIRKGSMAEKKDNFSLPRALLSPGPAL